MNQNNNNLANENTTAIKKKNEKIKDWRNEHGQPNFEFLESLADKGDSLSLEKLKFIADDLDADYNDTTSSIEIVKKIILAIQSGHKTTN